MNLTLSLLTGLLLLLPGIAVVAAWNHGGQNTARRPELQLTSVSTLLALLGASVLAHLAGYAFLNFFRSALIEAGTLMGSDFGAVFQDPYEAAFRLSRGKGEVAVPAPEQVLPGLATFLLVVLAEAGTTFLLFRNRGVDIVLEPFDLRGQGWVYQNVVRPMRHGFRPIAYVFTNIASDDRAIGYEGVVADIRQGADGEVKALCLGEPSRFVYELRPSKPRRLLRAGRPEPDVEIYDSEWVGGVLALEPSTIRNIVIHLVDVADIDQVVEPNKKA